MTTVSPTPKAIRLFNDTAVDGSSSSFYTWGPRLAFQLAGTWDGATITLQTSLDDGTTWTALTGHAYTSDTAKVIWTTRSMLIRATISSAGAATVLNGWILLSNDDRG